MKSIYGIFLVFVLLGSCGATSLPETINGKRYVITTNHLDAAAMAERKKRFLKLTGGVVTRSPTNHIVVINTQETIKRETFQPVIDAFANELKCQIVYKDHLEPFNAFEAKALIRKFNTGYGIIVVDSSSLPMSLIAIEDAWGILNIAPLRQGKPTDKCLEDRFQKMIVRVCTVLFGGAESEDKYSAMQSIHSVADLDAAKGHAVTPSSMTLMRKFMQKIGAASGRPIPYVKACEEGWAPQPTNEYQRILWQKSTMSK